MGTGKFSQVNNDKEPIANAILSSEWLNAFPLKSEKRQGCGLSSLLLNIILEILVSAVYKEKK